MNSNDNIVRNPDMSRVLLHTEEEERIVAEERKEAQESNNVFEHDVEEFPEGGFGWLVVLAEWLIMACTFGMVNSFGIYQTYYQTEAFPDETAFKISVIGALQPFCIYIFAIPTVTMMHYLGSRVTVGIGALIQVFSFMMMSLTTDLWQLFITQGLLFGMGGGIIYLTGMTVVMQWFKKKRAMAMGIVSSGSSLGGVYWPIAVRRLIKEVGFAWTNRIIGFIYIPLGVIMVLFLKSRLPLKHEIAPNSPITKRIFMLKLSVLNDWRFLTLTFSNFIGMFGLFPGLFYIDLYANKLGIKLGHYLVNPDYILSILNAASLVGRVVPGILADHWGRMNVLFPFLIVSGVSPLALWLTSSNSNGLMIAHVVVFGIASGVFVSLFPTCVTQLFGVQDNQSRISLFFAISGIGALFGPIIGGSFLPLQERDSGNLNGFDKLAIFVGVMMLGSAAIELVVRLIYSKKLFQFI